MDPVSENKKKINNSPKGEDTLPKTIDINYLKIQNYRTYHVDGVFGGLTPSGKLYIELFVQRAVTPQIVTHEVTQTGVLGKEVARIEKSGIIREIEAGLIMDIEVAKILRDWLNDKIKFFEENIIFSSGDEA